MWRKRLISVAATLGAVGLVASCEREQRSFVVSAPSANAPQHVQPNVSIRPGGTGDVKVNPPMDIGHVLGQPYGPFYAQNAQAQSDGQSLYENFNCVGCHAHGGGGIGPPLMDDLWIYGSDPSQIYETIVQGRPNGMPSFRGRIPDYQVWEIVGYVRSLSGQANPQAATGREDHMRANPPPNSMDKRTPLPVDNPTTAPITGGQTGQVPSPSTSRATEPSAQPSTQPATEPATNPTTSPSTTPTTTPTSP